VSKQRENNNSVFAEKSPDKGTIKGEIELNNASMVNSPDLSPVKNVRYGEEEAEIRKTKVSSPVSDLYYSMYIHFLRNRERKDEIYC